jgi:hypothetical protein
METNNVMLDETDLSKLKDILNSLYIATVKGIENKPNFIIKQKLKGLVSDIETIANKCNIKLVDKKYL